MFNGAQVMLAGYVATDPTFKANDGKAPKTYMRVAWTSRYRDRVTGEWRDGQTSYATVNCWRGLAGNAHASFRKGQPILVTGRLQVREFDTTDGKRRTAVDIEADSIGHDLFRGYAVFSRNNPPAGGPGALAQGEAIRAGLDTEHDQDAPDAASLPADDADAAGSLVPHEEMFDGRALGELADAAEDTAPVAVPF
jgi:single-strand DNA-binding protein